MKITVSKRDIMKNKKKNRSSYSLSAELKNALKYMLIWGMILIFSAYLLSDSEILGNVKQQARPDTWSMIGAGGSFEEEFTCKTNRLSGVELFLSTESASVAGTFQITLYQNEREIQSWQASRLTISSGDTTYFRLDQKLTEIPDRFRWRKRGYRSGCRVGEPEG